MKSENQSKTENLNQDQKSNSFKENYKSAQSDARKKDSGYTETSIIDELDFQEKLHDCQEQKEKLDNMLLQYLNNNASSSNLMSGFMTVGNEVTHLLKDANNYFVNKAKEELQEEEKSFKNLWEKNSLLKQINDVGENIKEDVDNFFSSIRESIIQRGDNKALNSFDSFYDCATQLDKENVLNMIQKVLDPNESNDMFDKLDNFVKDYQDSKQVNENINKNLQNQTTSHIMR